MRCPKCGSNSLIRPNITSNVKLSASMRFKCKTCGNAFTGDAE